MSEDDKQDMLRECREWLSKRLREGERQVAEQAFVRYPGLAEDDELALEVIYFEYVLMDEIGERLDTEQWMARFPNYRERLLRLTRLHDVLGNAQVDRDTLSFSSMPRQPAASTVVLANPTVGRTFGNYEILEEIGRGGMGVVYRARHLDLNRTVALKVILANLGSSSVDSARFLAEAETIAQLQHANIVTIHEVGVVGSRPFLALEYVDGGTLEDRLNGNPMAPVLAARYLWQLATAAEHAHERGIIHRDIKPANVLMTSEGLLKLTDFGLAKRLNIEQQQTQTGALLGTPSYMSPEQANSYRQEIGPATDIYGLGVVLYELLTGRVPFVGETYLETLDQVRNHDPVPPRELVPKIPIDLETICLKCLEKVPKHRYESALKLALDLKNYLDGESIHARPPTVVQLIAKEVFRSNQDFPAYRQWSKLFLTIAPIPPAIHLVLTICFQHWFYFPQLIIVTTFVTFGISQYVVLGVTRSSFQYFPAKLRRHAQYVLNANLIGELVALLGVWWHSDPHQPVQLLQVYPIWSLLIAVVYFSLAFEFGIFHVIGTIAFLLAFPGIFFPFLGPLCVSLIFLCNMGGQGLLYRKLATVIAQRNG